MKISIIGCGNMGLVYARSFLRYDIVKPADLLLAEKSEARRDDLRMMNIGEVVLADDPKISGSDLVILAVKPQDFTVLAPKIAPLMRPGMLVLSIMAGITIEKISGLLSHPTIIRAMPNSPVEVGMGMTGFSANAGVSIEQIRKVENLLSTTGRTVFFEDENMLDAITALSGSGPAYFYYIVRAMVAAGKEMGMTDAVSAMLVKQTMLGAFHLINNANKSFDDLIKTVASKGGTTEAALTVFENHHVHDALVEGIVRAEKRAKELSQNA
jgi:pyrroline-5-carboxylate reductase